MNTVKIDDKRGRTRKASTSNAKADKDVERDIARLHK